jgi:hypothetical protein
MPRAAAAELRGDAAATMLRYATLRDARRATALRRCALPLYAYAGAARDYAMRRRVAAMLMFYARSRARSKSACATSRYSNMAAKTAIVIIDAASGSHGAVCPFFALQRCRAAMPRVFDERRHYVFAIFLLLQPLASRRHFLRRPFQITLAG